MTSEEQELLGCFQQEVNKCFQIAQRLDALLIASILCFESEIDKNSQMCEELHELVEILDKEHQKLIEVQR